MSDLAREMTIPLSTLHGEVKHLEEIDLITSRRLGRTRMLRANTESAAAGPLTELLILTEESGPAARHDSGLPEDLRHVKIVEALNEFAVSRRGEPFTLASGARSHYYIDVKAALCRPPILRSVSRAIADLARRENVHFTHVGGLTMGADGVAIGVSLASGAEWFSVRKEPKERGHSRTIEGAQLDSASRVLLVDDVVSTGGSTLKALDAVLTTGAAAVAAIPVVDRGGNAARAFTDRGVRYMPLVTAAHLGIPSLGNE
jgi:orotate phosphoribosyltransferase